MLHDELEEGQATRGWLRRRRKVSLKTLVYLAHLLTGIPRRHNDGNRLVMTRTRFNMLNVRLSEVTYYSHQHEHRYIQFIPWLPPRKPPRLLGELHEAPQHRVLQDYEFTTKPHRVRTN